MIFRISFLHSIRKFIFLCFIYGFVYFLVCSSLLKYAIGQTCTAPSVSIEIGQTCNDVNIQSTTGSTVTNFGTINFNSSNTALFSAFNDDLRVENKSTGLINGQYVGVSLLLGTTSVINNLGSIQAINFGLINDDTSRITHLNNSGEIRNTIVGLKNEGFVSLIDNSGSITASLIGIDNWLLTGPRPQIDILNNTGTLGSTTGTAISNNGVITTVNNLGTLFGSYGIDNDGSISRFNNSGDLLGDYFGIVNYSRFGQIINSGTILTSLVSSVAIQNYPSGTIDLISNTGTISGASVGIKNQGGSITEIQNNGTISGFLNGIQNTSGGIINVLTNLGTIESVSGDFAVLNGTEGRIQTLNNLQGVGNSAGALTYRGSPENYNIIVRSQNNYGQIIITNPSGTTTFGIYTGSTLSKGTYSSVLYGITSSNLNNTSGTFKGFRWNLSNSSLDIWDLIVTGASTADTQQSLVNTASVLQGTFTLQNSVMVNGFTYDCSLFDKRGICVSAGGRNTTVQAQGINNTSGLLIASYRLDKNNSRIGAWVDQNLSVSGPGAVKLGNSTPMIGLFGVWSQRPDGVGAEVKVSAAYGQKDTTITRQVVGTSEAGSGGSQLISQGAQVVAKYGFAVMPDVVVSPYAGVRYTQNNMGGYTEATSSTVTAPLTYSALNTNATTALAGAEARYRGIPKTTLFASAGVETDTNTSNGSYSATGVDGLTPVNFNPNPVKTRPTATVGGYYDILKNQRIGITGIYRQEPFQAVSTTTVLATYTIGL